MRLQIECRLNVIFAEEKIRKGAFAERIGVSRATLSEWCNEHRLPMLEQAYVVAEELKRPVTEIWIIKKPAASATDMRTI